ncbi:MFS transporter [Guptibacillus hwajinpoensis]|uniref:MFS family permease n=1 Tax=Guptibacillus hwajinpoensis TaxID=208199 RepID=A0ABU0K6U7_9BACL|nr:MFS transporter [Alkalihalobacillus hemicentroti]MDQ0484196.1 MFS family permease [Alkalihalobacillus hemicentroti]
MGQSSLHKNSPFFYGWYIVLAAAVGVFFSGPGQTYAVSVFIDYYIQDFGWSRSLVSGIYSSATLAAGLLLFIVGRMVDKHGQRRMMLIIGSLLAIACFWNSFVLGPVMLFIGFFMLRLFGQGSMTLIPNTLVPQWFVVKRGRALSFMAIGGFLSSASFPPLNTWLIASYGWENAWRILGSALVLILLPIVYFFVKNKPEDIGLLPDNAVSKKRLAERKEEKMEEEDEEEGFETNWTVKEAMRTRAFWFILFCVSIPALVNTGLTFHLFSILGEQGVPGSTAALILSIMAIVGFPVTMVSGFILERVNVHIVLGLSFIGQIIFILLLTQVNTYILAIGFAVLWGIIGGIERITLNIIWPNYFGREHLGSIKGIATTTMVIGSAFGPLPFGIAYDVFGGYTEILLIILIFPILGTLATFLSPPPKKTA